MAIKQAGAWLVGDPWAVERGPWSANRTESLSANRLTDASLRLLDDSTEACA